VTNFFGQLVNSRDIVKNVDIWKTQEGGENMEKQNETHN